MSFVFACAWIDDLKEASSQLWPHANPYILAIFIAWLGHQFFLKQFMLQRAAELHERIFYEILTRIENAYTRLGNVRSCSTLFSDSDFLKLKNPIQHVETFSLHYDNLEESLQQVCLILERYDSVDGYSGALKELYDLRGELTKIYVKISLGITNSDLSDDLKKLFSMCTRINLKLQDVANLSKKHFFSLVTQIKP